MSEDRKVKGEPVVRFNSCSPPQHPAAPPWFNDPELDGLQQELRAAGERLSRVGVIDPGLFAWFPDFDLAGCMASLALGAVYFILIYLPARLTYAAVLRGRFRRRLKRLAPEQRPAALRLLKLELDSEAGPIARGLIRHLERPTELVAASLPPGSGREVSPTRLADP
jgi:hypothetical protein